MREVTSTSDSGRALFRTESPAETRRLAAALGRRLTGGDVLALDGPLGAGKTTFAKGLAEGLSIDPRDVTSPTFLLVHEIEGRVTLRHIDAYRVHGSGEIADLLGEDLHDPDAVVLVEWAGRVADLLPDARLDLAFEYAGEESRTIAIAPLGDRALGLVEDLRGECSP